MKVQVSSWNWRSISRVGPFRFFRRWRWVRPRTSGVRSDAVSPISGRSRRQIEEILRAYVFDPDVPHGELLFPSPKVSGEELITDTRRDMDAIGKRAGWKTGEIRTKMFRHSYCAARLQTLDRDAPVSPWTVAKEMGHGGRSLVDRVYGHLGEVRHRAELVEYRIEQHSAQVKERLEALSRS
ncbi:MAG TPA: hypothetical protein VJ982_01630 [Gemmatimonadota bacterium]|nr:hypothetical protein [Gemmatimonadota bacterium]